MTNTPAMTAANNSHNAPAHTAPTVLILGARGRLGLAAARAFAQGGWQVLAYTVNDVADAGRLLALGVDGLITDAVDVFAPALD